MITEAARKLGTSAKYYVRIMAKAPGRLLSRLTSSASSSAKSSENETRSLTKKSSSEVSGTDTFDISSAGNDSSDSRMANEINKQK